MPIADRPFEIIGMDAIGPLPLTINGNRHIIVISDYFSRWVEGYAIPDLKTETVAVTLEKFIATHGVPEHLITDRGSSFMSKAIQSVYEKLKIRKHSTTAYHPASDGVTERANGIVINALKHLVDSTDYQWDRYLHLALMAYRTAFHSTIQDTPAHIVYGRDLVLPVDLITQQRRFSYADTKDYVEDLESRLQESFELVKKNLERAAEKQEQYRARRAKDKHIAVGDLVLLHTPATKPGQAKKFQNFNKGPYRVKVNKNVVNFQICHINNPKDIQWVHVDRLTKIEERLFFPSFYEAENNSDTENIQQSESQSTAIIEPTNNNSNDDNIESSTNIPNFYTYKITKINNSLPNNIKCVQAGGTRVITNSNRKMCLTNSENNSSSVKAATSAGGSNFHKVSDKFSNSLESHATTSSEVHRSIEEANITNYNNVSQIETNNPHDNAINLNISKSKESRKDSVNTSNQIIASVNKPKSSIPNLNRPLTRGLSSSIGSLENRKISKLKPASQSNEMSQKHHYYLRQRK